MTGECVGCSLNTTGPQCNRCIPRHFQINVDDIGAGCRSCDCNGNEDPSEPNICNPNTGVCLKCASNTAGEHCEVCAAGYHGDAVNDTCRSERKNFMVLIFMSYPIVFHYTL